MNLEIGDRVTYKIADEEHTVIIVNESELELIKSYEIIKIEKLKLEVVEEKKDIVELKVGEYIRTTQGYIAKITEITKHSIYLDDYIYLEDEYSSTISLDDILGYDYKRYVVKHSIDILDLIEVGDYVNGKIVTSINCNFEYIDDDADIGVSEVDNGLFLNDDESIYFDYDVESVVTHEQFKNIEYKIKKFK